MSESSSLSRAQSIWLIATVTTTLAPHAMHLPMWAIVLCAALLAARTLLLARGGPRPHPALIALLALATGVAVKVEFQHFFGKDPGVALLAVLLCLKLLESHTPRDIRAAVLLSFFLQLGLFLYSQTLAVAGIALIGTLFATITMLSLEDERTRPIAQLRTGILLLTQGLPFMLALFVLFPRIQGPLWGLPTDAYSGMTGLSDTMTPGSISELGLSDAIAFRADFKGPPPPPSQRYWRGPVLTRFDGRTWRPERSASFAAPPYVPQGPAYDYRLTLEPHNQTWLLALDFPDTDTSLARYTSDYRLLATQPIRVRTRIELRAFPATAVGIDEAPATLTAAIQLPSTFNPRSRKLAQELAKVAQAPEAILARTLEHLRRSALTYTLTPPRLGTHSIDEFLFDTRRGFCEHFASAFVFLMRAAGVPARVVTGYQGGEINPVDLSLVVRQSDAHAWAEVWLAGRGWVRVDPTAQAAPRRIENGLASALPEWEPLPYMRRPNFHWLRDLRNHWDALSNTWNQQVLGYNSARQHDLLSRLGFSSPDRKTVGLLLGGSAATVMLMLLAWALMEHERGDPLDRAWRSFCQKLGRHGVARHPWEGPIDYGRRLAMIFPRQAQVLTAITSEYARLRYGAHGDVRAARQLSHRIRRLILK